MCTKSPFDNRGCKADEYHLGQHYINPSGGHGYCPICDERYCSLCYAIQEGKANWAISCSLKRHLAFSRSPRGWIKITSLHLSAPPTLTWRCRQADRLIFPWVLYRKIVVSAWLGHSEDRSPMPLNNLSRLQPRPLFNGLTPVQFRAKRGSS